MTPLERVLDVLTSLECKPRHSGTGWSSKCPAHPDKDPSLSVSEGSDGKVLLNCHAGCRHDDVAKSLGMTEKDLFPPSDEPPQRAQLVATYPYQDENGVVLYESLRYSPKTFRQRKPVAGGYEWSLNGVRRVPFRLPELLANVHEGETVFVVEGEKDVLSLVSRGFCATCNAGGADAKENKAEGTWQPGDGSKWRDDFAHYFKGADVVILPDNDGAGRAHAERVRRSLERQAKRIRVVDLPGLPEKGDVSDFFAAGHTAQELQALVDADPAPEAPPAPSLWLSYGDIFSAALAVGEQYPTGFPTLDRCTEGGLAKSTVTVIQGRPGIGKTLVAQQIALHMASTCAVAGLFQDEGLAGARIRLGQQLGLERRLMRRPTPESSAAAVAALEKRALFWRFLKPTDVRSTVELFAAEFDAMAPKDLPRVWILDSVQVLRSENVAAKDRRVAVSDLVWRVKDLAEKYQAVALLVSQVGRGSYRSQNEDDHVNDLAAGTETSAIEYAAQLILHIAGDPKTIVKIRCPKNRYTGDTFQISCHVDFPTATYHEIPDPGALPEGVPDPKEVEERIARGELDKEVLAHLQGRWAEGEEPNQTAVLLGVRAARQLQNLKGAKESAVVESLARLVAGHQAASRQGKRSAILYTRPGSSATPPPPGVEEM